MGEILIKTPLPIERVYNVTNAHQAAELLEMLDDEIGAAIVNPSQTPDIEPPRRHSLNQDLAAAFGLWADRPETGAEIADAIRAANRRQT